MRLLINGEDKNIEDGITLKTLVEKFDLRIEHVVCEVNGKIVKRDSSSECVLLEGDKIEIVQFIGGG